MGATCVGDDREQAFLMPPSLRDWVPEGHLVWTVLDAVAELDPSGVYAAYRAEGHGLRAVDDGRAVALSASGSRCVVPAEPDFRRPRRR
jgi:hypothetical protein